MMVSVSKEREGKGNEAIKVERVGMQSGIKVKAFELW
jgi:hypothetical protein